MEAETNTKSLRISTTPEAILAVIIIRILIRSVFRACGISITRGPSEESFLTNTHARIHIGLVRKQVIADNTLSARSLCQKLNWRGVSARK